jgi:hypothetical protein
MKISQYSSTFLFRSFFANLKGSKDNHIVILKQNANFAHLWNIMFLKHSPFFIVKLDIFNIWEINNKPPSLA